MMDVNAYKLIIFDWDGTLAEYKTGVILPGVQEWFAAQDNPKLSYALASNQGGVGLRHWMETSGFGSPDEYPSEMDVLTAIANGLGQLNGGGRFDVRVCFAYQSKRSGNWSPIPPGKENSGEWSPLNRKPLPGMLLHAMQNAHVKSSETLMVGDWDEDVMAAQAAGCTFVYADNFFERD